MADIDDYDWMAFTEVEVEWYRLWFEFLKLSNNKWSDEVARDFDIDYFKDDSCKFEGWWTAHKHLFRKLNQPNIEEITSTNKTLIEDYLVYKDDDAWSEFPGTIPLFVHMWFTRAELREAFEGILNKYHPCDDNPKRGPRKFDGLRDGYSFFKEPETELLKKCLAVYRVKSKPGKLTLIEIEKEASKEFPILDKSPETGGLYWRGVINPTTEEVESQNHTIRRLVNRYLKYAVNITKYAAEDGYFPVYKKKDIDEVKKLKKQGKDSRGINK